MTAIADRAKFLYINSRDEFLRVDIAQIACFESDGNYTNIILTNGQKATVSLNLARMQALLTASLKEAASVFVRVGKRHIININYVFRIAVLRQKLFLSDRGSFTCQLSVSKEALKALKDMMVAEISRN